MLNIKKKKKRERKKNRPETECIHAKCKYRIFSELGFTMYID